MRRLKSEAEHGGQTVSFSLASLQNFGADTHRYPSAPATMSSRLQELSPNAEIVSKDQARAVNVAAAGGLQDVLRPTSAPAAPSRCWSAAPARSS